MNDTLFEDYLANRLSTGDVVKLKQMLANDREARARFVEVLLEWELLSETARQLTTNSCPVIDINSSHSEVGKRHRPSLRVTATRPFTRHILKRLLPMGALAATLMIALWAIRPAHESQLLGHLRVATAGVTIQRGNTVLIAQVGSVVQSGDYVQVADGAQARMEYLDQTLLSFDQRTDARMFAEGSPAERVGKHVVLVSGRVSAEVAKQPVGRPMIFTTPNAQATVIGTALSLEYAPSGSITLLEVTEGKVGIVSISVTPDVASRSSPVEVSSGNFAMVNGSTEIITRPINAAVQIAQVATQIPATTSAAAVKSAHGEGKTFRSGLRATYYKGNSRTDAMFSRIEPGIHADLGLDPQPLEQRHGDFTVIWSGFLQPRFSEKYLLTIRSDSSVKVFIDEKLVIDSWDQNHTPEQQGSLMLDATKRHALRVEYKQPSVGMRIKLDWVSKSQQPETIPAECLSTDQ